MPFRGFLWIQRILTELRSEKFEWFGPSPIEPFNSGLGHRRTLPLGPRALGLQQRLLPEADDASRAAADPHLPAAAHLSELQAAVAPRQGRDRLEAVHRWLQIYRLVRFLMAKESQQVIFEMHFSLRKNTFRCENVFLFKMLSTFANCLPHGGLVHTSPLEIGLPAFFGKEILPKNCQKLAAAFEYTEF